MVGLNIEADGIPQKVFPIFDTVHSRFKKDFGSGQKVS